MHRKLSMYCLHLCLCEVLKSKIFPEWPSSSPEKPSSDFIKTHSQQHSKLPSVSGAAHFHLGLANKLHLTQFSYSFKSLQAPKRSPGLGSEVNVYNPTFSFLSYFFLNNPTFKSTIVGKTSQWVRALAVKAKKPWVQILSIHVKAGYYNPQEMETRRFQKLDEQPNWEDSGLQTHVLQLVNI